MAILAIMSGLAGPALNSLKGSNDLTANVQRIADVLEQARAYAIAHNTYTWVGFFEEDGGNEQGTAGVGRVQLSVVASKTATKLSAADWIPANLVQLTKLIAIDNMHLDEIKAADIPSDGIMPLAAYQVGNTAFAAPKSFNYPLTGDSRYTFTKILQFSPQGDVNRLTDVPVPLIGIGLQAARGNKALDQANRGAILITGIGGGLQIKRP